MGSIREPSRQDRLRRPQLPRAREGARQRVPKEPLIFLKPPSSLIVRVGKPSCCRRCPAGGIRGGDRCRRRGRGSDARTPARRRAGCGNRRRRTTSPPATSRSAMGNGRARRDSIPSAVVGPMEPCPRRSVEPVVATRVNGEERQRGTGGRMVFAIPTLLAVHLDDIMTLEPGDLVARNAGGRRAPRPRRRGRSRDRRREPSQQPCHKRTTSAPLAARSPAARVPARRRSRSRSAQLIAARRRRHRPRRRRRGPRAPDGRGRRACQGRHGAGDEPVRIRHGATSLPRSGRALHAAAVRAAVRPDHGDRPAHRLEGGHLAPRPRLPGAGRRRRSSPSPATTRTSGGTLLGSGEPYRYALRPRTNFLVDLDEIPDDVLRRARSST